LSGEKYLHSRKKRRYNRSKKENFRRGRLAERFSFCYNFLKYFVFFIHFFFLPMNALSSIQKLWRSTVCGGIVFLSGLGTASAALIDPGDKPSDVVSADFRTAVVGFINYFLAFLGLVAVAFVVYAGILMVTSQGEDENTGKAKKILLYAGIGIIIVLLSFAIVRLIVGAGDAVA